MAREEDEMEDAIDPGEPPVVTADEVEPTEDDNEEGPEAHLIIDEETGQHFIAFEIEPPEGEEEEEKK